jgi:hypothetical protein
MQHLSALKNAKRRVVKYTTPARFHKTYIMRDVFRRLSALLLFLQCFQGLSRVTSSLSFFEVLALLEMVGHPPLGEPIKLASCVWE